MYAHIKTPWYLWVALFADRLRKFTISGKAWAHRSAMMTGTFCRFVLLIIALAALVLLFMLGLGFLSLTTALSASSRRLSKWLSMARSSRANKVDANQSAVVADLRKMGYSVAVTSNAGDGFPDLVVGYLNNNFLFEVKDPAKPLSKRALTSDQADFHQAWRGQVDTITCADDARKIIMQRFSHVRRY